MITFEDRPDKGENWKKNQEKRDQLIDRDLEKANNPESVFDDSKQNRENKKPLLDEQKKPIK